MWEKKLQGTSQHKCHPSWSLHLKGWPKKNFSSLHKSISKQQGDENTEKYQLWDINWCNTKIWEQKLEDMYGKQCQELVFRSWEYKGYFPI